MTAFIKLFEPRYIASLVDYLSTQMDNLGETVYRQLMHCLWKAERSDEVLCQYTIYKQVLAEELGVGPLEEIKDMYLRILKEREKDTKSKK